MLDLESCMYKTRQDKLHPSSHLGLIGRSSLQKVQAVNHKLDHGNRNMYTNLQTRSGGCETPALVAYAYSDKVACMPPFTKEETSGMPGGTACNVKTCSELI